MKISLFIITVLFSITSIAQLQTRDFDNTKSIVKNTDGLFDVVCDDNSQETVSQRDLVMNNLCPHQSFEEKNLDILFVIDDSGSMMSFQRNLVEHIPYLVEKLKINKYDFRIATVSSTINDGSNKFVDLSGYEVIDNNTPDMKEALKMNLLLGARGSHDELLFLSAQTALSQYDRGQFYRKNSTLHIVIFSDEPDQSGISAQEFIDFLDKHTLSQPNDRHYKISLINNFNKQCKHSNNWDLKEELILQQLAGASLFNICTDVYDLF